jgi:hypothetical protein
MGEQLWAKILRRFHFAADPFFAVKMRVNQLVITEVAKSVYPDAPDATEAQNAAAMAMIHSSIHGKINDFAREIVDEIKKQKAELEKPKSEPSAAE